MIHAKKDKYILRMDYKIFLLLQMICIIFLIFQIK